MTKIQKLMVAEDLIRKLGSYWMFQKSYTDARQFYDIETSLEMALEQQDLLPQYLESCEKTTVTE
jgi:hypothetical protein